MSSVESRAVRKMIGTPARCGAEPRGRPRSRPCRAASRRARSGAGAERRPPRAPRRRSPADCDLEALEAQRHRDHVDDVRLVVDDEHALAGAWAAGLRVGGRDAALLDVRSWSLGHRALQLSACSQTRGPDERSLCGSWELPERGRGLGRARLGVAIRGRHRDQRRRQHVARAVRASVRSAHVALLALPWPPLSRRERAPLPRGARAEVPAHWTRRPQLSWYWQLQGALKMGEPVDAYDVDGFETSAAQVERADAQGRARDLLHRRRHRRGLPARLRRVPGSVLGRANGWPGERWIDIRQLAVLEPIMSARFQMCHKKGFDAVEPDNIEAYANRSGFPITAQQQLTYNQWVAEEVHSLGMAVLQKNDAQQSRELEPLLRRRPQRAVQPVRRMRELRALPGRRQAGAERRVPPRLQEVLRPRRGRRHHGRALQPRAQRCALRTLLGRGRRLCARAPARPRRRRARLLAREPRQPCSPSRRRAPATPAAAACMRCPTALHARSAQPRRRSGGHRLDDLLCRLDLERAPAGVGHREREVREHARLRDRQAAPPNTSTTTSCRSSSAAP